MQGFHSRWEVGSSMSGSGGKERELMFSVTPKDCILQTFSAGGPGGQNQNRRSTGVRWIHEPSGARGESREERSQLQNKRLAWKRMVDTAEFRTWVRMRLGQSGAVEAAVEREMWPVNLKTEVRVDGKWVRE